MLQNIITDCGLKIIDVKPVHGGDINQVYCLISTDEKFFLKLNDAKSHPGMFEKEAKGLEALQGTGTIMIPRVIRYGLQGNQQYLLLEWLEKGKPSANFWKKFGTGLANLHKQPQHRFGWKEDNYIGSLTQVNTIHQSWYLFYRECRIMPLVKELYDLNIFSKKDIEVAGHACNKFEELFPPEPPALLHGDLWSGNFMVTSSGDAAMCDPAVYCGHREMDLGMTRLFGGFDQQFYNAYHEAYPLEAGWKQRLQLTQLYPLLVHAILFGGHYVSQAREILLFYGN